MKNILLKLIFLLSLIITGYFYYTIPHERYNNEVYENGRVNNVVVSIKDYDYLVDIGQEKIIFTNPLYWNPNIEYIYEIYLPSDYISKEFKDIKKIGLIEDKDKRYYIYFSYQDINLDKIVIKESKVIQNKFPNGTLNIIELNSIKETDYLTENLFLVRLLSGLVLCLLILINIIIIIDDKEFTFWE